MASSSIIPSAILQKLSFMSIMFITETKGQMGDSKGQIKGQNLASAVYLVTSFFNDNEPLKWRLRTLAMDMVSHEVKDKNSLHQEIISLLSIAKASGLISSANHEIIVREFHRFRDESEKRFDLGFLLSTKEESRPLPIPESPREEKDKILENPRKITDESRPKALREFGAVSVKKNSRQSVIIGLLKRKKEIMIKDVAALISDCSEKTLQRELLAMVEAGILRKIGEKRWSRYSLA